MRNVKIHTGFAVLVIACLTGLAQDGHTNGYTTKAAVVDTVIGVASAIGDASIASYINRMQFDEIMANRLNAGLSTKQFHIEMIRIAPKFYWSLVIEPRLCQEADIEAKYRPGTLRFCNEKMRHAENTRARRDALKAQIKAEENFVPEYDVPWTLSKLVYRSKRLMHGTSEYQVHCEFLFQDRNYEVNLVRQGFDTKDCDRPF